MDAKSIVDEHCNVLSVEGYGNRSWLVAAFEKSGLGGAQVEVGVFCQFRDEMRVLE